MIGERKWKVTDLGKEMLLNWILINPEIIESMESDFEDIEIQDPPIEIASLLQSLKNNPKMHKERCTNNLWVPSPNRIENLRTIVQICGTKISKNDLFELIEHEFNLRISSVESMLPFLKASGLIQEVGRNIYLTTPVANAWLETSNDLDLIRILHCNMKCVGEVLEFANDDVVRNNIYDYAKQYGMNNEKMRWIIGFLLEASLVSEPQYLHIKTTNLGKKLLDELPLEKISNEVDEKENNDKDKIIKANIDTENEEFTEICNKLHIAASDPTAENKAPGLAFEEAITSMFRFMGFKSEPIGGSGDTDVVLRWEDEDDNNYIAIVDGKSKSSGSVSHIDISDVAIDTHKEKNSANYVIIVGPGFSGDTIRNFARKKEYALITDQQLIDIARTADELGLSLNEISTAFKVPDGLSQLEELVSIKKRNLEIISEVVKTFCLEQSQLGSLSPRDVFLLLRNTNISPLLEELIICFDTLSSSQIGILNKVDKTGVAENIKYTMFNVKRTSNYLIALAKSLNKGLQ